MPSWVRKWNGDGRQNPREMLQFYTKNNYSISPEEGTTGEHNTIIVTSDLPYPSITDTYTQMGHEVLVGLRALP